MDSTSASPQIIFLVVVHGSMYDLTRVGGNFLGAGRVACREAACDAWHSQAFARGFGGMLPRGNFFKWFNLVCFGAYFHKLFT